MRFFMVLLSVLLLCDLYGFSQNLSDKPVLLLKKEYKKLKQNFTIIDISKIVNKGLRDEVEDDGKGGWMDSGTNDFRMFKKFGKVEFLDIPFNILNPQKNNNKSVIVLRGYNNKAYPKQVEININKKCGGVYFLHTASWGTGVAGSYTFVYADGKKIKKEIIFGRDIFNWWGAFESDVARPVWTGKNLVTDKISLYLFAWRNPRPSLKIKKIILETGGDKNYMAIFGITLSDKGAYLPKIVDEIIKFDTSKWFKYIPVDIKKIKGTPIDMSFLLDAPAGKHGFIKIKNDKFYFQDGTEISFWGMNIVASGNFVDKKKAEWIAERLSQMGVNIVRFHHLDAVWSIPNIFGNDPKSTRKIDKKMLDRLDYLWYQMKKRGIYIYLDLLVHRTPLPNDGIKFRKDIVRGYKIEGEFDRYLIKLQKEYIRQLLLHKNPYTGLRLIDDPALVMMDIINEDSLFYIKKRGKFAIITDYYKKIWQTYFNKWLIKKYKTRYRLKKAWYEYGKVGLKDNENPLKGTVIIPADYKKRKPYNFSKARIKDIYNFLFYMQNKYYKEMYSFLKGLGAKCAITGSNHWVKDIADLYLNAELDFVDRHNYWDKLKGWGYVKNTWSNPDPMVKSKFGGIIGNLSTKPIYGKPFVISEWNCYGPNEYRAEGVPIMALYGSLHNWNPIQFAFTHSKNLSFTNFTHVLDIHSQPVISALWPVASLIFHKKYIKEAHTGYYVRLNKNNVLNPFESVKLYPELGLISKSGIMFSDINDNISYNNNNLLKVIKQDKDTINSITGELQWNTKQGLVRFESDRALGLIGFPEKKIIKFKNAEVKIKTDFAIFLLTSLDAKPIKNSAHIVVSVGARTRQTGMKITEKGRLLDPGKPPILIQPVEGTVVLKGSRKIKVYKLSFSGERKGRVRVKKTKKGFSFKMQAKDRTLYYEIVKD